MALKLDYTPKVSPEMDQEAAPSYDASLLPWNNRVRTSAAKLDEGIRAGAQAMTDLSNIFQPMLGMLLNEITPAGITVSRPHFVRVWPFDSYERHTLNVNGKRNVLTGHIRSRSGNLEYNGIVTVDEEGQAEAFIPMRARPFEERAVFNTPHFRVANNGTISVQKSYRTVVRFTMNDPETGENSYEEITVYLCPPMEQPDDAEFPNIGDMLGIGTIHAEAPEASGEGVSEKATRSRKAKEADPDAQAPVSLE